MSDMLSWFKEFTPGAVGIWTLVLMAFGAWWQVLPKFIDAWENRSKGIEARLQFSMDATLARYETELKHLTNRVEDSDRRHKECEERSMKQTERINHLEQEVIGFQRQLASQDIAKAGYLNLDATPATKAMVERMKDYENDGRRNRPPTV